MATLVERIASLAQAVAAQFKALPSRFHPLNTTINLDGTTAEANPWKVRLATDNLTYQYANADAVGIYSDKYSHIVTFNYKTGIAKVFGREIWDKVNLPNPLTLDTNNYTQKYIRISSTGPFSRDDFTGNNLEIVGDATGGGGAFMMYHIPGVMKRKFGMMADGQFGRVVGEGVVGTFWDSSNLPRPISVDSNYQLPRSYKTTGSKKTLATASFGDESLIVSSATSADDVFMILNKEGAYAINFGLDSNLNLAFGGISEGAKSYSLWSKKNLLNPLDRSTDGSNFATSSTVFGSTGKLNSGSFSQTLELRGSTPNDRPGMLVHWPGSRATYWGMDDDGDFAHGGFSDGPNIYKFWTSKNTPKASAAEVAAGTSTSSIISVADVQNIGSRITRPNGVALPHLMTRAERDADGSYSIMNWIPKHKRSGILNDTWGGDSFVPTSETTVHTEIQDAFNSLENINFPRGTYPILYGVSAPGLGQKIRGAGRGLTRIFCPLGFDYTGAYITKFIHYAEVADITIDAYQPLSAALTDGTSPDGFRLTVWDGTGTRPANGIIKYPWAVDISQCTRGRFDNLAMTRVWNGINATGNAGGCNFRGIEDGALNCGMLVADPLDFFTIESWESWVYGIPGSHLMDWFYRYPGYVRFNNADGLKVVSMNMWKKRIYYNNASQLAATFGMIKLDGGNASLITEQGRANIACLNFLTDAEAAFVNTGADISIAAADFKRADLAYGAVNPIVIIQGGRTTIGSGIITGAGAATDVLQQSGDLILKAVIFAGAGSYPKSDGIVNTLGGRLTLADCRFQDATYDASGKPGTNYALKINASEHHFIHDNFMGGRAMRRPASLPTPPHHNSGLASDDTF